MEQERRVRPATAAPRQGGVLDLTATRRREDLVLAVADALLACAPRGTRR